MAKWVVKRSGETLAEFESKREAQNEIAWYEFCDKNENVFTDNAYEIVKVEM